MGAFLFARHGETEPNARGVRCGGDLDVPLTAKGMAQAHELAAALTGRAPGIIVTSPLQRTIATAEVVSRAFGIAVQIDPLFIERRLGGWNGKSVAETEPLIRAQQPPPGGETEAEFRARVADALESLRPLLAQRPLVISSKGVARVMGVLLGAPGQGPAGNAQVLEFVLK